MDNDWKQAVNNSIDDEVEARQRLEKRVKRLEAVVRVFEALFGLRVTTNYDGTYEASMQLPSHRIEVFPPKKEMPITRADFVAIWGDDAPTDSPE